MSNGKKYALWGCAGCGAIIVVIVLLLVGGIGFIAYQGYQFGKDVKDQYQEVAVGYKNLSREHEFAPPNEGIMPEEKVGEFLNIRKELVTFASDYIKELEQTGERIEQEFDKPGILSKIRGAGKIRDIVKMAVHMGSKIGEKHINLLDESDMSPKEYQWLTTQYLGTLSKAEENNFDYGAELWQQYLDKFESGRKHAKNINVDLGETSIDGDEMNKDKLSLLVKNVEYNTQNAELIKQTGDQLLPDEDVTIIDFLALQLNDIIKDFTTDAPENVPEIEVTDINQ